MKSTILCEPTDPYSPDWASWWAANPNRPKGIGAEAAVKTEVEEPEIKPETTVDEPVIPETDKQEEAKLSKEDIDDAIKDEDWRNDLPEDLRKTAERFASKADAVRAIENFRKRESQIRVPGKDATDEERAAYRKAVGIPDKAELYEYPELPKGQELTDDIKANRKVWGQRFMDLGIPKEAAKALAQAVNEDAQKYQESLVKADKAFAQAQEDALRLEWKGEEFDKNKILANRAFNEIARRAGQSLDDLTKIETKDGRFLMDRAEIVRMFAMIGREMGEGTLGPAMSEGERETVGDEVTGIRKQIEEAQEKGDSKRANQLYQKEQKLLEKMGNKSIVGAGGRMV